MLVRYWGVGAQLNLGLNRKLSLFLLIGSGTVFASDDTASALLHATKIGDIRTVRFSLRAHSFARPILNAALLNATGFNHTAVVGCLLRCDDVDVNCYTADGKTTPLIFAAWRGNFTVVKALLKRGADPDQRAGSGLSIWMSDYTAEKVARKNGHDRIAHLLQRYTAMSCDGEDDYDTDIENLRRMPDDPIAMVGSLEDPD